MNNKPEILYHGSCVKITDGVVRARPAYINGMKTPITAVFATPSPMHAKVYACMRIIASGWGSPGPNNTMYIQKINPDISGTFYMYELDSDGFEQDGSDYYSLIDKKIKNVYEFDVTREIKDGKIKVYVLKDEFNNQDMSGDDWRKIKSDQSKFELYNPNIKNVNVAIIAEKIKSSSLDK